MIKLLKSFVFAVAVLPAIAIPSSNVQKKYDPREVALSKFDHRQIDCLAANIYYEARSESDLGKELVALVTMNRVNDDNYPNDVCSVVTEKRKARRSGRFVCQFSWYCEKGKEKKLHSGYLKENKPQNYEKVYKIAQSVYMTYSFKKSYKNMKTVLFYHANYVSPNWDFRKLVKVVVADKHIFYKPKGAV